MGPGVVVHRDLMALPAGIPSKGNALQGRDLGPRGRQEAKGATRHRGYAGGTDRRVPG